ncbi:tyrosine-type recombinase/integrase [Saccharopolyspora shandongensis]|uniref:tyrosine-type recombinase/integrase n=1 Tax=Saccharopolyspora shandongensis TaxID=418495 RepID=UPI0033EA3F95
MASAEQLPSGRWRGVYRDAKGNKKHVRGTFPRKSDAREAAQAAEVDARRQAARDDGTLPARTPWGEWWDLISEDRDFDSATPATERTLVKLHVRPRWGDTPLNEISRKDLQQWVKQLSKKMDPASVRRTYGIMSVSINQALGEDILTASPCAGIRLPKVPKKSKKYMTEDNADRLRVHLSQEAQDAMDLGFETGLRPGELAGLHIHRVDLESGWLEIVEVYVAAKKAIRAYPKDDDSRFVPLTAKAVEIIHRRIEGRDLTRGCGIPHLNGEECESELVLRTPTGRPMTPHNQKCHLQRAARKAGVPYRGPYTVRRGYATRLARGGIDAFELADLMGHSDLAQTREYVQRSPQARERALAALGEKQGLAAVDEHGTRGTARGTKRGHQATPEAPNEDDQKAG